MKQIVLFAPLLFILFTSCGGGSKKFKKNPVDILMRDMSTYASYSIILHDMDADGSYSTDYKHQYKIIKAKTKDAAPEQTVTQWYNVDENFFLKHQNNMGMEIASKSLDGKVSKVASPPGYSNYVGNSQYGRWRSDSHGNSFWEFYGKYAMMRDMFSLATYPIYRSSYNDYHTNYYGRRAYYGPRSSSGTYRYGTGGSYTSSTRPKSKWGTRTKSTGGFGKSTKSSKSSFGGSSRKSSAFGSSSSSRSSHSSSRYSSSSVRSRSSGGFGK